MPHKAFCILIFSKSLLFQSFIFVLLKAPCKGFVLMENIDRKTNHFGNIGHQIYLKCSFSHSKLIISVISKTNKTWHFRIKMFKILIFCNHSISSMIRNELNLFISYIFNFMPLLKCIIMQFPVCMKLELTKFRQIQLISL